MTTTPGTIRDRMLVLIEAIVPAVHAGQRFRAHREQLSFRAWAEANPAACLRRFTVRSAGATTQARVTSTQYEQVEDDFVIEIAYPNDARHGAKPALGVDDVVASDAVKVEAAVGVSSADSALKLAASIFRPGDVIRDDAGAVTFLSITYRVEYARSLV